MSCAAARDLVVAMRRWRRSELVVGAATADAGKLDPHLTSQGADKGMLNWVFNALVRIRPGQINPEFIEPDLAESWTANATSTEWTFKIRKGVHCHGDYGEFTAEDAAYSLQARGRQGALGLCRRHGADRLGRGRRQSHAEDDAEDADPEPARPALQLSWRHDGVQEGGRGAGRRLRQEADRHRPLHIRRVPAAAVREARRQQAYFRGAPQIDEITYRYMPSDATRDLALRAASSTWCSAVRPTNGCSARATVKGVEGRRHRAGRAQHPISQHQGQAAGRHPRAPGHRACARPQGHGATPGQRGVARGDLGHPERQSRDSKLALADYNMAKAKQLLADAGYPNGLTSR